MTVPQRQLGPNGPSLSQVTYGTMRLRADDTTQVHADHLCLLHDFGIDTHHSSHEYDSHPAYLRALAEAQRTGRRFRHIVKLAEPGFDHHRFDPARLTKLLDDRLTELNVDTVDSLQWLFRTPDPGDDPSRMATLKVQAADIAAWADQQSQQGKLQNLSFFPYSIAFARLIMDLGISATPTMYLNLLELESAPVLADSTGFIAIRPLAAGALAESPDGVQDVPPAAAALRFTLLHPNVTTSVLSVNSQSHLDDLMESASTQSDISAFEAALAAASGLI